MMRDHRSLRVFQLADELVFDVYELTKYMPQNEEYNLTKQMKRSVHSMAANIVEGCARHSAADLCRFLDMSFASLRETEYHLSVAVRLGFLPEEKTKPVTEKLAKTARLHAAYMRKARRWKES